MKALKNSTDARRDAFRDKVMTVLGMFVESYFIRLIPKYLQNLKLELEMKIKMKIEMKMAPE